MRVLHRLIKSFLGFYKRKLSVFVIIFLWPCLVVRKNQDFIIRKSGKQTKKNQQNNQENQTKICFSVFEIIFLWPCLVVRKNQDTKIRKTDQKKTNKTIKKTKPKFVSVFFFFSFFFFYFLNPFITSFSFFPASVVNKSTCKFI